MKILWLTWKDITNPAAGGAEVVTDQLATALAKNKHDVILLTSGYPGCKQTEKINGYQVIRVGNRFTVYFFAMKYFLQNLKQWPDKVIEEINTVPFFSQFYTGLNPYVYIFQLARIVWFHEIIFPLSLFGFLSEPIYLKAFINCPVITESESTRDDLLNIGFDAKNIHIVPIALTIDPIATLKFLEKFTNPTLLSFGAIRSMKQTHIQIRAFELARKRIANLKLVIAGKPLGKYGKKVLSLIKNSQFSADIQFVGAVTTKEKINLLQKCHLLLMTSAKEGWGLVVTEAASQGTPSVVFNTSGLRDSVRHNITGIVCSKDSAEDMADQIVTILGDQSKYKNLQLNAWKNSKTFTELSSNLKFFEIVL
jgi:glycosyltransferase involved in cell wall biosynthesis